MKRQKSLSLILLPLLSFNLLACQNQKSKESSHKSIETQKK